MPDIPSFLYTITKGNGKMTTQGAEDAIQKLYIESSTLCNLDCTMCMRRTWTDEKMGHMDFDLYRRVMEEAAGIDTIHTVFFGGVGEPMFHPRFVEMVRLAKQANKRVECVTNGSMLNRKKAEELTEAGLDEAWISVDGMTEAQYEDIREKGSFHNLMQNLKDLLALRSTPKGKNLMLGLTFVAMRDNIHQLPDLMRLAAEVGADDVKITNILPYTKESEEQALYTRTHRNKDFTDRADPSANKWFPRRAHVDFPIMDLNETTKGPLYAMLSSDNTFSIMGDPIRHRTNYCRFVQEGNVFVRWDGEVSQCMALLHQSKTFLFGKERDILPKSFGNVKEKPLYKIWTDPEYVAFRRRVREFDFSPCSLCGGCYRIESNQEDCYGNEHPTCGACIWAQGFIQCP